MTTLEIRPADGGADAQGFALELEGAIYRALQRENNAELKTVPRWL